MVFPINIGISLLPVVYSGISINILITRGYISMQPATPATGLCALMLWTFCRHRAIGGHRGVPDHAVSTVRSQVVSINGGIQRWMLFEGKSWVYNEPPIDVMTGGWFP